MIYTPEPRLEPDHHLEEYIAFDGDESDADFIQTDFNDDSVQVLVQEYDRSYFFSDYFHYQIQHLDDVFLGIGNSVVC